MPWPMTSTEEIPAVLSVTGPTYHVTGSMDLIHSPPKSMKKDFKRKKEIKTPSICRNQQHSPCPSTAPGALPCKGCKPGGRLAEAACVALHPAHPKTR